MDLLTTYDVKKAEDVVKMENIVDRYEDELGTYLVKLSSKNLTKRDSHTVSMLLHVISDFERISDHAVNIMEAAQEMYEKKLNFSESAVKELGIFTDAIREIIDMAIDSFVNEDLDKAANIEPLEEVMDFLKAELKDRHVKRLTKGECTIELGFVLNDLVTNYERVSDHCSNIAVCLIQVKEDGFDTHGYIDNLKSDDNENFKMRFHWYKEKYMLP